MIPPPRAFFTIDSGAATTGAAVVARLDGRWRLVASGAVPSGIATEALLDDLVERVSSTDPGLLEDARAWSSWARIESRTHPPRRVLLAGPSDRVAEPLGRAFVADGWLSVGSVTPDRADVLLAARALRDADLDLVAIAAPDGLSGRDRDDLADVMALAGAIAGRRDDLPVLICGASGGALPGVPPERTSRVASTVDAIAAARELVVRPRDGRDAFVRSIASLAAVLDLRVEGVDVGLDAGTRVVASPEGVLRQVVRADAALVPQAALDDQRLLDAIARWSPLAEDAWVVRDRLRNLRIHPWRDAGGDGARLRLAAARAALDRLQEAWHDGTEHHHRLHDGHEPPVPATAPDLIVASGGAFAVAPAPAVALALIDTLREPGAAVLAFDHARMLGPLGALEDEIDRRRLLADLADDILLPLGSAIMAPGLRPARKGSVHVSADGATTSLVLTSGAVQVVDLPPGMSATAEVEAPDDLFVGARARRVAFEVSGGLGGLLIDTRDIPLRLPDRPERRRELLDAWQRPLWTNAEP